MARRFCALLLVLGLAVAAAAQAHPDSWTPRRPCGSSVAISSAGDGSFIPQSGSSRPRDFVRLTQAALRVIAHVSDLPAWLSGRRGDGRSWGTEMKAAIEELKLRFAEASGRTGGAVGAGE
jgi:hypothetical protein